MKIIMQEESISGMLKCLHGLTQADNGKLYQYDGSNFGW